MNPCKDQGGEELVAVLCIAVLFLIFLWKTESKRGVEVCVCVRFVLSQSVCFCMLYVYVYACA